MLVYAVIKGSYFKLKNIFYYSLNFFSSNIKFLKMLNKALFIIALTCYEELYMKVMYNALFVYIRINKDFNSVYLSFTTKSEILKFRYIF